MTLNRLGVFAALVAGTAFVGCSSDKVAGPGEESGSVSFDLTTSQGVVITTVSYDLNTQGGADVASGSIPVPNPDSTIELGIDSLPAPASYTLAFSAVGMFQGQQVPCVSAPAPFSLTASQDLTLPTINLVCTIETTAPDTTGSVNANANVVVEQIAVNNNIVEVFSYGPRSVRGLPQGTACVYPPIQLNVFNNNTAIAYSWAAAPDGALALNAANTSGTYTCASGGSKTLTITAAMGTTTASKSITVTCDASACSGPTPPVCGDGIVEGTEECDANTPRCTSCVITPVCGDGVVDGPNGDCSGTDLSKPTCNEACDTSGPSATCNGNCQIPLPVETCTDGILNNGETAIDCGGPNCAACPVPETCTDGILNNGETAIDCGGPNCAACPEPDVCRPCISAAPETAPVQAAYCDVEPLCLAAQDCVLEAGCFLPIPAVCYCGPDIDNCRNTDFIPTGACVAPIRAGTGNPPDNATVLDRFFDFGYPTGVGMLVLDEASRVCTTECF